MGATMGKNGTLLDSLPSTQVYTTKMKKKQKIIENL